MLLPDNGHPIAGLTASIFDTVVGGHASTEQRSFGMRLARYRTAHKTTQRTCFNKINTLGQDHRASRLNNSILLEIPVSSKSLHSATLLTPCVMPATWSDQCHGEIHTMITIRFSARFALEATIRGRQKPYGIANFKIRHSLA